jgi:hypothetical protein
MLLTLNYSHYCPLHCRSLALNVPAAWRGGDLPRLPFPQSTKAKDTNNSLSTNFCQPSCQTACYTLVLPLDIAIHSTPFLSSNQALNDQMPPLRSYTSPLVTPLSSIHPFSLLSFTSHLYYQATISLNQTSLPSTTIRTFSRAKDLHLIIQLPRSSSLLAKSPPVIHTLVPMVSQLTSNFRGVHLFFQNTPPRCHLTCV